MVAKNARWLLKDSFAYILDTTFCTVLHYTTLCWTERHYTQLLRIVIESYKILIYCLLTHGCTAHCTQSCTSLHSITLQYTYNCTAQHCREALLPSIFPVDKWWQPLLYLTYIKLTQEIKVGENICVEGARIQKERKQMQRIWEAENPTGRDKRTQMYVHHTLTLNHECKEKKSQNAWMNARGNSANSTFACSLPWVRG